MKKRYPLNLPQLASAHCASRAQWQPLDWHTPFAPGQIRPDAHWHDWLTDQGSLTRRLQQASAQQFQVQPLQQRLCRPTRDEARLLGMGVQDYALIRQVALIGCGQPWVFARTVIPLPTLARGNRHLLQLGNRSLGSVLFKSAGTRRHSLQLARANADFFVPFIWGRRSVFELQRAPLLVTELFLPPFCQHQQLAPA